MINLYLAEIRFENCSAVRRECVCNGRCYCYDSCTKHLVPFTTLCSYDCIVVLELLCTALIYVYAVCAFFQSKICINGPVYVHALVAHFSIADCLQVLGVVEPIL